MNSFSVMPLCSKQLLDINPKDIIYSDSLPLYRNCATYKSGGGYDQFPQMVETVLGLPKYLYHNQFVVQLYGCPLKCPYCYVTKDGIFGKSILKTDMDLIDAYKKSRLVYNYNVFHLMGGAPALYLDKWQSLLEQLVRLDEITVFHSDLLLIEHIYDKSILKKLAQYKNRLLLAVSIKGVTNTEYEHNTGRKFDKNLFLENRDRLLESGVPFYVTFTGIDEHSAAEFMEKYFLGFPWFCIPIINYKAINTKDAVLV